jgi:hypothetical protein
VLGYFDYDHGTRRRSINKRLTRSAPHGGQLRRATGGVAESPTCEK